MIENERKRLLEQQSWLRKWKSIIDDLPPLPQSPWKEKSLRQHIPTKFPKLMKVGAVDGGLLQEELRGFDLALTRAVVPIFKGVGREVEVEYYPEFSPKPTIQFFPSFPMRQDFSKVSTLLRLKMEYRMAKEAIKEYRLKILYIDGSIYPLKSDLPMEKSNNQYISDLEIEVKETYLQLIDTAIANETVLVGVVKDSRSRDLAFHLAETIVQWLKDGHINKDWIKGYRKVITQILDVDLASIILSQAERVAWFQIPTPFWMPLSPRIEFMATYIKTIVDDVPLRVETLVPQNHEWFDLHLDYALAGLYLMGQHGLGTAVPSIIIEADERAKLKTELIDAVVEQIAVMLGMPVEYLKKRRFFTWNLD